MNQDAMFLFRNRVVKESLCQACKEPCRAEMAICVFCKDFKPTVEVIDAIRKTLEAVHAQV
jgi:hypothetical protein